MFSISAFAVLKVLVLRFLMASASVHVARDEFNISKGMNPCY
jgi:hypothetical protein